jgi:hypothetical protein
MGRQSTSRSRTGLLTGPIRRRPPSTYERTFSLIPLGSLHCPSSTFSRRPNRNSSHSIRPVTPLRSFINFAFLRSIYWELALIYIKPGCADPQTSLFLYFCIDQLITLISAATTHTNLVIRTHILSARHRCPISFHKEHCTNSTHSLPSGKAV